MPSVVRSLVVISMCALGILPAAAAFGSPQSQGRLLFVTYREGYYDVYLRDASGTETELTDTLDADYDPEWSPVDPNTFVFSSKTDGDFEIYLATIGTDVLTGDPAIQSLQQLTNNGVLDRDPTWSPDGSRIAFARSDNPTYGNEDIYVMNKDLLGNWGAATLFARTSGSDRLPEFSPDGTRLAFSGDNTKGNWDLYLRNADGSITNLTASATVTDWFPTWNPTNGNQLAFASTRKSPGLKAGVEAIYVMNVPTRTVTRITNGSDYYPDWSPDGTKIAMQRYPARSYNAGGPSYDVVSVNVAPSMTAPDSGLTTLVHSAEFDGMPDW